MGQDAPPPGEFAICYLLLVIPRSRPPRPTKFGPATLPFLELKLLPFRLGLDRVAGSELAFQHRETKRIQ
jgi:hypothetical protein